MKLEGKKAVVVGLAQTGVAVARFLASRGANVIVTDGKPASALEARIAQLDGCAVLELGGHKTESFTEADFVVMSPGVPELDETRAARAAGVEVIAEIELAYRMLDPEAQLIAITGTNGKSTTTALTGALCEASGAPTFCGGNLGNHPMIEVVDHPANCAGGLIVVEVAGFMLETAVSFRPKVAACLNITEDHLDRYGTMDVYAKMKTRIFEWQQPGDIAIANANDARVMAGAQAASGELYVFDSKATAQAPVSRGAMIDGGEIVLVRETGAERYPSSDLDLIGTHNLENAMVAYLAARACGVSPDAIRRGAKAFRPQKHRMERVGVLPSGESDIVFYDDSKGTNVAAVAASITGFPRPVVLICGGVDKGGSYQPMFDALAPVARGLVMIGEARPLIRAAAEHANASYPLVDAESMEEALARATELAEPGDAVVLSPACSSYDMFRNFGERGMAFREALASVGATRTDNSPGDAKDS